MKREQPQTKDVPKNLTTRKTVGMTKTRDGEMDREEAEEIKALKMTCNIYFIFANIILMSV